MLLIEVAKAQLIVDHLGGQFNVWLSLPGYHWRTIKINIEKDGVKLCVKQLRAVLMIRRLKNY